MRDGAAEWMHSPRFGPGSGDTKQEGLDRGNFSLDSRLDTFILMLNFCALVSVFIGLICLFVFEGVLIFKLV